MSFAPDIDVEIEMDASLFPASKHLVVTTSKKVFAWSNSGIAELFSSGSEGIVAAKNSKDGSGILAVADAQVVVLHDTKKGMEKSYRLKGMEVCLSIVLLET
jgi:hypothetical protein